MGARSSRWRSCGASCPWVTMRAVAGRRPSRRSPGSASAGTGATAAGRRAPARPACASRSRRSRRRRTPRPGRCAGRVGLEAMARLAMPPGQEPMPSAQTSVPLAGSAVQAGEDDVEEHRPPQEDVELRPVRLPAAGQRVVRGLGGMGHERGLLGRGRRGGRRRHSARCASTLTRQNRAEARRTAWMCAEVAAIFAL